MTDMPDTLVQALISAATAAGADAADAVAVAGTSLSIDVRDQRLETAQRSEGTDMGLRVFVGQRSAIVASSDTSANTISEMAERAVFMAREAPEDPHSGLASPDQLATNRDVAALELADPSAEPEPGDLESIAREGEAAALDVKGVAQVESASAAYGAHDVAMAATNGFSGLYRRTSWSRSVVAIAGEGTGMERDYDADGRIFGTDLRSASDIGQVAGQRTVERLDARKPQTGHYPVLFDERISSSLIGHLLAASNGAAVARGQSWLQDATGEPVLPDGLSVIEDPHVPRLSGSRPFDGEGLPTARRVIVDNGVLTGFTLDLASARKLDLAPTGNAARGTTGNPSPANWNITLTQGDQSRDDLMRDMGTGLLVTSMIGATINPNTGDYSRGAAGFWVENGQIAYPVNECTIAGNLRDMLRVIVPANDARPWLSRVVPSLLVEGMTLAGT